MVPPSGARPRNRLLSSLPAADFARLREHLEPLALELRFNLQESNKPIKYLYFPESGIASIVGFGSQKREIEVGIIGREGMSGIHLILGSDRSPHAAYMQVAGHGHRIPAADFRAAIQESPVILGYFLRFVQVLMIQTAQTAIANGQGTVEARLARWLLMADDRIEGDVLPLTHEFLAIMLAVRRAGVTTALHQLERRNLIAAERGEVKVLDRDGLRELANGLYGTPEAEYRRLFG